MLSFGTQCVIVPNRCTYAAHCKTIVSLWFFNDSHVAHLARSLRSERAWRDPLRRCVAVGRDRTVEMFILTRFYKGFGELIRFRWY